MIKKIFDGFGCEIFKCKHKYFVKYDTGHFEVKMTEVEITKEEFEKFKLSEKDAYEVLLIAQNRKI